MGFVQTGDMLELYKRNNDSGVLITLMEHGKDEDGFKNKYGMHSIIITGVDQELGNVLTFGLGMCSHKSTIALWWIMNKFIEKCDMVKRSIKVVWAPLDRKMFGMLEKELPSECKVFATQFSVLETFDKICSKGSVKNAKEDLVSLMKDILMTDEEKPVKAKLTEL